jgi:hypothetical protein
MISRNSVAALTLFAALGLFLVACTSQAPSPLSPSGASLSALNLEGGKDSCADGIDNDGDKAVDCEDSECATDPACTKGGTPCSPGYWKNHIEAFNASCGAAAALPGDQFTTCAQLLTALTCKGSDASCGRSAAAAAMNTITGCVE